MTACRSSSSSRLFNHTTADFGSGISGRLAGEVIGMVMNHNGPTDHIGNGETVGKKGEKSIALIGKQRRHIPHMQRMRTPLWIQMRSCISKGVLIVPGTGASLVNMKTKKFAWSCSFSLPWLLFIKGQAIQLRHNQRSIVFGIKINRPMQRGMLSISPNRRPRRRRHGRNQAGKTAVILVGSQQFEHLLSRPGNHRTLIRQFMRLFDTGDNFSLERHLRAIDIRRKIS